MKVQHVGFPTLDSIQNPSEYFFRHDQEIKYELLDRIGEREGGGKRAQIEQWVIF